MCYSRLLYCSPPCLVRIKSLWCDSRASEALTLTDPSNPVALITCDLGVVLEVAGGVAASALAFIFPAGCYLQLLPASTPWTSRTKLPAVVCAGFGVVVLILNVVITLVHAGSGASASSAKLCV